MNITKQGNYGINDLNVSDIIEYKKIYTAYGNEINDGEGVIVDKNDYSVTIIRKDFMYNVMTFVDTIHSNYYVTIYGNNKETMDLFIKANKALYEAKSSYYSIRGKAL